MFTHSLSFQMVVYSDAYVQNDETSVGIIMRSEKQSRQKKVSRHTTQTLCYDFYWLEEEKAITKTAVLFSN